MKKRIDNHLWLELREYTGAAGSMLFFSAIIAILSFLPTIYMYQIIERVLTSRNDTTLFALFGIVAFLALVWVALEVARLRVLQRIAIALDEKISARVFDALNRGTDRLEPAGRAAILQDLNMLRDFVSSPLIIHAMDLCFVPLIILGASFIHPTIGLCLLAASLLVGLLALASQFSAREDMRRAGLAGNNALEFGRAVMSNSESIRSLGMLPAVVRLWRQKQRDAIGWQDGAMRRAEPFSIFLRYFRHISAPLLLTAGAMLYLSELISAGAVVATILLVPRVIGPVDAIAGAWRALWNATHSAGRLDSLLREAARQGGKVPLPAPDGPLVVTRIAVSPPSRDATTLSDISFSIAPGQIVAVVGASGAGKSTLARALTGVWPLRRGSITLGGHELAHWDQDELGRSIGYVAQDVDLLPGTVAENIARFESSAETTAKLIEAVRLAGIQEIISGLPEGLNTALGPGGSTLSSGQRQRIALARAIYGLPRLVVLDEPNSNLDSAGELQLAATLAKLRESGSIVVLVTHRLNMLAYCDHVLVIHAGTVQAYGPRAQIIERLAAYRPRELPDGRAEPGRRSAAG